ncbi:cytochrome c1 [Parvibaculum sp.]|jgi:cytochrome c1|uniref:cytochrome c1 n=1 Tax=Parvibaculum sp. TaxID=2024848 RepID=UPI0025FC0698|nr:cytochrome c1 [Parvibaculum sp.]
MEKMMKTMIQSVLGRRAMGVVMAGAVVATGFAFGIQPASAASEAHEPEAIDWSFNGPFGTYDRSQLRRGFKVFKEVCATCHSAHMLKFRDLAAKGGPEFTKAQAKVIAAEYTIEELNGSGDMEERPRLPKDPFPSPYDNPEQAAAALGVAPPDLSVMAKAREGGPDYIHALLTGYQDPPAGREMAPGSHYNPYFPGGAIAMPPPLFADQVEYEDGTPTTLDQESQDVAAFLMWVAEPKLEQRHEMGFQVMLYLIALAGILYFATRKVWSDVH